VIFAPDDVNGPWLDLDQLVSIQVEPCESESDWISVMLSGGIELSWVGYKGAGRGLVNAWMRSRGEQDDAEEEQPKVKRPLS
jgi:hypothetical protein